MVICIEQHVAAGCAWKSTVLHDAHQLLGNELLAIRFALIKLAIDATTVKYIWSVLAVGHST
jgi:hypothetical protein